MREIVIVFCEARTFKPQQLSNRFADCYAFVLFPIYAGSETFKNMAPGWVNVKDVAMAHILALEVPSAKGRYCLVERVAHYSDLVKELKELYPNAALPEK